ncbi:MAG: DUF4149 domain-containing protein [Verrucomicrobiota bacterium]
MIAFLRFVGLINAAIWLGAAVFLFAVAGPASLSPEMERLLGARNFPFFSGAFAHVLMSRYFVLVSLTAVIALAHLLSEWLYMGRPARKLSAILLGGLIALVLVSGWWIEPRMNQLHKVRHSSSSVVERESAAKAYRWWHAAFQFLHVTMIGGLIVYSWRVANPSDAPRFISSVKFRG